MLRQRLIHWCFGWLEVQTLNIWIPYISWLRCSGWCTRESIMLQSAWQSGVRITFIYCVIGVGARFVQFSINRGNSSYQEQVHMATVVMKNFLLGGRKPQADPESVWATVWLGWRGGGGERELQIKSSKTNRSSVKEVTWATVVDACGSAPF